MVLPVHNGERFVLEAVGSVLAQTHRDLELIVVDDGSTDATPSLLDSVADGRLRVISQPRQRVAAARNRGIEEAGGPVLAFIDADDAWAEDKIERQLAVLRPGIVVYSDVLLIEESHGEPMGGFAIFDRFPKDAGKFSGHVLAALLCQNFVSMGTTVLWKEDAKVTGGFRYDFGGCEDWDFWLRCAERLEFLRLDAPLTTVRRRSDSLSTEIERVRAAGRQMMDDAAARLRDRGELTAQMRGALGLGYFQTRNMRPAAANLFGAAIRRPWRLRSWKWLAASLVWHPVRGRRATVSDSEGLVRERR